MHELSCKRTISCIISYSEIFLIRSYKYLQVNIDFETEPIGKGRYGESVYFKDIWPSSDEISEVK